MAKSYDHWYTHNEWDFVRHLGTHVPGRVVSPRQRISLLRSYLKTMRLRTNWGQIKRGEILWRTVKLIEELKHEEQKRAVKHAQRIARLNTVSSNSRE